MTSPEPIGGFFGLEPQRAAGPGNFPHEGALLLNTGRACFEYVIRARGVRHVHLPRYLCDVMMEPVRRTGISFGHYALDAELEPAALPELGEGEFFLYANYFGCTGQHCRDLAERYGERLILDCSQALFFDPPAGAHVFYSVRKFVGVPEGGCLYTDAELAEPLETDVSDGRYAHLFGRNESGPEAAYVDFQRAERNLEGQGIKRMSPSTRKLLATIDFARVRKARRRNFEHLQRLLGPANPFPFGPELPSAPMVYPFLSDDPGLRDRLIAQKVFVATYWPNVLEECSPDEFEHKLSRRLLPLPIDQRYGPAEMKRVAALVLGG